MSDSKVKRPFYFMVPFWGERYRNYFVDLCLPSLLSPNNISLLRVEDGHCFLIATTREDWQAIEHLPIMERLRQHAMPTLIEIDLGIQSPTSADGEASAKYASVLQYLTPCLKKLLEAAYCARAYGFQLCPDTLFSDGIVASLLKYAQAGYHLVLCPALRQTEEAVLVDLQKRGLLPERERLSMTGQALTIPPRLMADLFVRHLHPEMWIYEEDGPPLPHISPFHYWRVPGNRGIILHTFYGGPILMDFEVVADKHSECLERGDFESVYYNENFANRNIHIIQDSDEVCMVSLTPEKVNFSLPTTEKPRAKWMKKYEQLHNIRESMWYYVGRNHDAVRRDLFHLPIRWHVADLDEDWLKEEQRIDRLIDQAVGEYYRISRPPNTHRFPSKLKLRLDPRTLLGKLIHWVFFIMPVMLAAWSRFVNGVIVVVRVIARRIGLALHGDKVALRWWGWRLRKLGARLAGQPFHEPRPPAP